MMMRAVFSVFFCAILGFWWLCAVVLSLSNSSLVPFAPPFPFHSLYSYLYSTATPTLSSPSALLYHTVSLYRHAISRFQFPDPSTNLSKS